MTKKEIALKLVSQIVKENCDMKWLDMIPYDVAKEIIHKLEYNNLLNLENKNESQ